MINEFEQAEQEGIKQVLERLIEDKEKPQSPLETRVEDLENSQLKIVEPLIPLTPSDDLETVKARLNEILLILNQTVPI